MQVRIANTELQTLIKLQELDLRLKQLREKVRRVPVELASLDRELGESRDVLETVARNQEEGQKDRRRLEADVEALRQKLSKYKDQLMAVKTNKEYQAVLHEISNCEKDISAKEDEILDRMVLADEWDDHQRKARQEHSEREKEIKARRSELETFLSDAEGQIDQLDSERERLRRQVVPELIRMYERIATVRHGLAVTPALDQSCQACHVRLRPQLFNDVKTNQQIITCESCNRILYYPEPL